MTAPTSGKTSDHLAQQQADDSTLRDLVQALRKAADTTPGAADLAVAAYVAVFGLDGVARVASSLRSC